MLGSNPSQLAAGDAAVVRLKPLSTPLCVEAFEVPTALQVAVGDSIPLIYIYNVYDILYSQVILMFVTNCNHGDLFMIIYIC